MNDNLSEQLNLPRIGGTIIAFFDRNENKIRVLKNYYEAKEQYKKLGWVQKKLQSERHYESIYQQLNETFKEKAHEIEIRFKEKSRLRDWDYFPLLKELYKDDIKQCYAPNWKLEFIMAGPDARHLVGCETLEPNRINNLIISFKDALERMQILQNTDFAGSYSKKIESSYPTLEVVSENKLTGLRFWVSSKNWRYFRELTLDEVREVIKKLEQVEQKAKKMMQTLEVLYL